MSNRLLNPGFETAGAETYLAENWEFRSDPATIFAYRDPALGRTSGSALVLARSPWPPVLPVTNRESGWAQQENVPVTSGRTYEVRAYVKTVLGGGAELACSLDGREAFSVSSGDAWELQSGLVTSLGTGLFRFDVSDSGGTTTFHVDDCELEEVPIVASGMHYAYKALYNRLKTINGSGDGYHHNLGGRVVARHFLPGTQGCPKRPFIALPVEDDGPIEENEDSVRVTLHQPIILYPSPKTSTDPIDSTGAVDVLKWQDDIMRCLMPASSDPQWDLDEGRIEEVGFISKRAFSEKHEALHPYVEFVVKLVLTLTREELGPE